MSGCERTRGLIDRVVDGRVTEADRAHASACASCGPVLARAATFDDELRRSARALVAEELPLGVLDQSIDGRILGRVVGRRSAPGLAAILAAVAILLTATIIAIGPGTGPLPSPSNSPSPSVSPSPAPTPTQAPFVERFGSTAAIIGLLAKAGYACNDGLPLESVGTEPDAVVKDAAVCGAPDSVGPFMLAVIVGEAANGKVAQVTIKADLVGGDTAERRAALAAEMARVFALALLDEGAGQSGGSWARVHVPELEPRGDAQVVLREVEFHASRHANASYFVTVRGARAG